MIIISDLVESVSDQSRQDRNRPSVIRDQSGSYHLTVTNASVNVKIGHECERVCVCKFSVTLNQQRGSHDLRGKVREKVRGFTLQTRCINNSPWRKRESLSPDPPSSGSRMDSSSSLSLVLTAAYCLCCAVIG